MRGAPISARSISARVSTSTAPACQVAAPCRQGRDANVFASGIGISEPTTATTTTMTTTFGSSRLWPATTSAAAMFRCDVPRPNTNLVSLAGPPRTQPVLSSAGLTLAARMVLTLHRATLVPASASAIDQHVPTFFVALGVDHGRSAGRALASATCRDRAT